ncbi:MAG TPA: ABC transporter permease subunit [Verrucomicrobiae bacterium]|jgi:Cu-processing system permease protein|nr:ABC transporter permease subunit [Verrucomicrobiae bacterium]
MSAAPGRWHRVGVVAREEFRQALESRWLFGFTALLAALVLGLSFFGMAQSREVGFQGFARVTLSLMNLVLFIVPLTGLMLGVTSVTGGSGALPLLLAQPVSRREVLTGKLVGLGGALTVAQLVGFGGGGIVVALSAGADQVRGFAALTGLSIALGWLMVSTSLMIAVLRPDRLKAMSTALFLWLLLVVAYDLVVLGATTLLGGLPLQRVLVPALLLNPVDIARVLTTLAVGSGALFGPTSAVLMKLSGTTAGIGLGLLVLIVETIVPAAIAMWVFQRRDG